MGNTHSLTGPGIALDSFVAELGNDIIFNKSLGSTRFLKTVKCRHRNGFVVIKIFIKRDPGMTLRNEMKRLKAEREVLFDVPNIYNYQAFVETDRAGYIIRQWVASNLYDRISTRPFLSVIEKKWIAFQILNAMRDARNRKVAHGDIKSENILVTSWNWVYVSDFASFKPVFLPLNDPSDFSYFYDTSGRRTCYIAPERFYTSEANPDISARKAQLAADADTEGRGRRDGRVTEAMDCFSVGCVLAELFLEGAPLFTLSQLFKYREGEFNIDAQLNAIEDEGIRNLIKQMIALQPAARPSFDLLLHNARGVVFAESFYSFLHNYLAGMNEIPSPSPFVHSHANSSAALTAVALLASPTTKAPTSTGLGPTALPSEETNGPLPNDSDRRIERVWADFNNVEPYLLPELAEGGLQVDYVASGTTSNVFKELFPVELHIPNYESKITPLSSTGRYAAHEDGPALIILSLLCANLRTCQLPSSKLRALDVFLALCVHLTDEAKLDRMVPYIVDLLHDDAAIVRSSALRTLMQLLMLVTVITPFNASIFPDYIIPNIAHLIRDPEESVRCVYAQCIVHLADTAVRYLEMGQALRAHGAFRNSADAREHDEVHVEVSYDASLQDLQTQIQDHLAALLIDPSSVVKRAVLHNISSLCIFLGRQSTNDVLLSHMITYLNDRDWLLRLAFFESIVDVAACAGGRSLDEYILPLMIQALSDVEEAVVAKVLSALTSLCELGLFQKMRIWELMGATLGFLYHPNIWIRQGATAFMTSAAKHLPPTDVWCILYPSLRHFLTADIHTVDERSLLTMLKPPLARQIFEASVQWAMRAESTAFWKGQRRLTNKAETPKESMMASRRIGVPTVKTKSEEDEGNIAKLRQLGMTSSEEAKVLAMREYITKLANTISSFASRMRIEASTEALKATGDVELQKLNVVPQTVFLKARTDPGIHSPRITNLRRGALDPLQKIVPSSPRNNGSRRTSIDQSPSGAPFEDLRRRLATINGSGSSLPNTPKSRLTALASPNGVGAVALPAASNITDMTPPLERPGSPSDSVISTTNSTTFRAMQRLQVGVLDGQKAAPAVGASTANATGLLEPAAAMRSDGSPEPSGHTSPISVSGTIRNPGRPRLAALTPISTYDGQEPGISHVLEHLYLDNNQALQNDFGPHVHEGPVRRRNAARQSLVARDGGARRPEATLVAHLSSHTDCVTGLAVSPDHMFFVSCADDKTVRIWDTARLERNVTAKPRHTYSGHHARVKCVCILEGFHCFASAADDGSLHVVRVDISTSSALPKYGKLHVVREHQLERAGEYITFMTQWNTDGSSNLIYATTHSVISILDLRTMNILQTMENPRHHGPITTLCLDRKKSWVLAGTVTGVLTLWDLRFGLLLKSWKVAAAASSPKSPRIHQCVIHPSKGKGRWVIVALESRQESAKDGAMVLEVWDIEKTLLVESFVVRSSEATGAGVGDTPDVSSSTLGAEADTSPAAAIAALVRSRQRHGHLYTRHTSAGEVVGPPSPQIRAIIAGLDFGGYTPAHRADPSDGGSDQGGRTRAHRGFMVSGSEDRMIRLWDLAKVERTVILSAPTAEGDKPVYHSANAPDNSSTHFESWPASARRGTHLPPQRIALINASQQDLLRAHQDTITALACIDAPFRGGIVSGDRAGVIKVWRVDGTD